MATIDTSSQNSNQHQGSVMKLGPKLFLAMAVLITVTVTILGFGIYHISGFDQILINLGRENEEMRIGTRANQDLLRIAQTEKNIVLTKNSIIQQEYIRETEELKKRLSRRIQQIQKLSSSSENMRINLFKEQMHDFLTFNSQVLDLASHGKIQQAAELSRDEGREAMEAAAEIMRAIVDSQDVKMARIIKSQQESVKQLLQWAVILSISGILFAVGIYVYMVVGRIRPQLRSATDTVTTISDSITSAIKAHEERATQQSVAIAELSTTVHELGSSSRSISDQTEYDAIKSREALEISNVGSKVVEDTIRGMGDLQADVTTISQHLQSLNEKTKKIDEITDMVADFTNETKMLAMNAAIEAVRAGEQGKGFSVISVEIRKLAEESKHSVERINLLVRDIRKATEATVQVAENGKQTTDRWINMTQQAADAFMGVADALDQSSNRGQQIALNTKQMKTAINQVVEAINTLNSAFKESVLEIKETKQDMNKLNTVARWLGSLV
ncbi:MAG: MCP four helix bundle domain-containing protein [Magnetococcales bacterium]|nr:MCP four helix bundle domain-containing protein [Magnetococcales bacterium]